MGQPICGPQSGLRPQVVPIYNLVIRNPIYNLFIRNPIRNPQSAIRNVSAGASAMALRCVLSALAQQDEHSHRPASSATALDLAQRPVAIRTGIGSAHDAAPSPSPEARAFYDQGLAYLHSYVWLEAARSFNQALRLDSKIPMAHLGLTIACTELNAAPAARAALERAQALASTDHDRRHVAATPAVRR